MKNNKAVFSGNPGGIGSMLNRMLREGVTRKVTLEHESHLILRAAVSNRCYHPHFLHGVTEWGYMGEDTGRHSSMGL